MVEEGCWRGYNALTYCVFFVMMGSVSCFGEDGVLKRVAYIYRDSGVSTLACDQAAAMVQCYMPDVPPVFLNSAAVQEGGWSRDACLFIMPGGADIPYMQKLCGTGNQKIKDYVANGGAYLGLCAGAYYASRHIDFAPMGIALAPAGGGKCLAQEYSVDAICQNSDICADRELGFFPGRSVGPVFGPYYGSYSTSRAASVVRRGCGSCIPLYYNGGGYFELTEDFPSANVLAHYESNHLPAIVFNRYGMGRVVLSGVHFEYDPHSLPEEIRMSVRAALLCANKQREQLVHAILDKLQVLSFEERGGDDA